MIYRYAAGVTLKKLQVITTSADQDLEKEVFGKKVILESFAVYWQPVRSSKDILFAELIQNNPLDENQIDEYFNKSIYTRENPSDRMKFLIGPISSDAKMQYCPTPAKIEYSKPEVRLPSLTSDALKIVPNSLMFYYFLWYEF